MGNFRIRFIAADDISYASLGEAEDEVLIFTPPAPEAILYTYRLVGHSSWSHWRATNYVDYTSVPVGSYTFEVRARDEAGNSSGSATRTIVIQ